MKDITSLKKKYEITFANKFCKLNNISLCNKKVCTCSLAAETWAYIDTIIPDRYRSYSIYDFDGIINDNLRLDNNIVKEVKEKICDYCWGKGWEEVKKHKEINKNLWKNSIINTRLVNKNNVMIYGETFDNTPLGRTMVASILLKEAIKLRVNGGIFRSHSYDWVDFSILKKDLADDNYASADYASCNWLVVDNIMQSNYSTQYDEFISGHLTPFFINRIQNDCVTIFIFNFDINKIENFKSKFGSGIYEIFQNNKTFKIALS